jgi:hypothetical protein
MLSRLRTVARRCEVAGLLCVPLCAPASQHLMQVLGSLMAHVGSKDVGEVDGALLVLQRLTATLGEAARLVNFLPFLKGPLDYIETLTTGQVRVLAVVDALWCLYSPRGAEVFIVPSCARMLLPLATSGPQAVHSHLCGHLRQAGGGCRWDCAQGWSQWTSCGVFCHSYGVLVLARCSCQALGCRTWTSC